jgi:hypothetical protein
LPEKEAKERQRLGPGKRVAQKCANLNGKASEAAARLTHSGSRYVEAVKSIRSLQAGRPHHPGPPPGAARENKEGQKDQESLTEPGALIADCYAGGAAFLAAAKATNRRWLATEQDETTVLIARKRLAEM